MLNRKNKARSEDCRRKIAEAHAHPIIQIDCNGKEIHHYDSLADAERKTGFSGSYLAVAARSEKKAYGYFWKKTNKE